MCPGHVPVMAHAAELKVLAGGSMTAPLNELGPEFEKATGHKLSIHFDSTPNMIERVNSGTPFDVVVVPVDVFKDAAAKARFAPGPTIDIARVGYGVVVRAGARKAGHLHAGCIQEGAARGVLDRLSAGERGRRLCDQGVRAARYWRGDEGQNQGAGLARADPASRSPRARPRSACSSSNVLIAPGVELAGPFPADLQQELVFTAAVAADTQGSRRRQGADRLSADRPPPPP